MDTDITGLRESQVIQELEKVFDKYLTDPEKHEVYGHIARLLNVVQGGSSIDSICVGVVGALSSLGHKSKPIAPTSFGQDAKKIVQYFEQKASEYNPNK